MTAWLGVCEGDDGIPLWTMNPTVDNIPRNKLLRWLDPYDPCIVLVVYRDGTCLVAYDGVLAFAVTACLTEILS